MRAIQALGPKEIGGGDGTATEVERVEGNGGQMQEQCNVRDPCGL